jgi:hypothetical protein
MDEYKYDQIVIIYLPLAWCPFADREVAEELVTRSRER